MGTPEVGFDGTEFYDHSTQTIVNDGWENWADNRPNNLGNDEHCAAIEINDTMLLIDGEWNDLQCGDPGAFICESSN